LARIDGQKMTLAQQKHERTISVLKSYIAGLAITGDVASDSSKKRKVCP
jgi:hypothetical protein